MTTEIALFPIPNLVAFPGTIVPLHVFEPRYRKMIKDAVEQGMMVGPCHTRKEISPGKQNQTMDQAMSTNQATYEPCQIFSAGPCDVLDVPDHSTLPPHGSNASFNGDPSGCSRPPSGTGEIGR